MKTDYPWWVVGRKTKQRCGRCWLLHILNYYYQWLFDVEDSGFIKIALVTLHVFILHSDPEDVHQIECSLCFLAMSTIPMAVIMTNIYWVPIMGKCFIRTISLNLHKGSMRKVSLLIWVYRWETVWFWMSLAELGFTPGTIPYLCSELLQNLTP